ncbi:MAG: hypothetical protein WCG30_01035 [Candidatus Saccharibacteria bacterium]
MSTEDMKDTIYIDVDEEITGIIDKIQESDKKVVALVLPKRASVFQSIVNLKLLKRSADKASKNIVLITSESNILPMAGVVGLHVAKTLHSKPEIPSHPDSDSSYDDNESIDIDDQDFNPEASKQKAVGELAAASGGALAAEKIHRPEDIDETIDIDDDVLQEDATGKGLKETSSRGKKGKKEKKDKSLKVPNFNKFRKILVIGVVGVVALIVLFLIFGNLFNKAVINISTKTQPVNANITINLDTSTKTLNTATSTVPAVAQSTSKSTSQSVPTTGQINNGNKATGSVSLTVACSAKPPTIPSGTGLSSNGIAFTTQKNITLTNCNCSSSNCLFSGDVTVIAVTGGANGNLVSGSTFTVSGQQYTGYSGTSSAEFTGGTDNMVNAVSQTDINSATQKIGTIDTSPVKIALENQLKQAGLTPIVGTFNTGATTTTAAPTLGTAGNQVTVTQNITYTMLGVQKSYLSQLVITNINSQINTSQQSIIDDGVSNAQYSTLQSNATTAQVTMQDTASVGALINSQSIKKEIAGKKSGDVQSTIKSIPGVTDVTVKLSPFWVTTVPTDLSKVVINISKS